MGTGIPEGWYLDPGLCGETAFLYPAWWDDILDAWPSTVGLQAETWDQYYKEITMADEIKRIPIKEFRELGFIQEINRRLLHPCGLALEVIVDLETGEEKLGGVWDYRDDPEGIRFEEGVLSREKYKSVEDHWYSKTHQRQENLGYVVQPVPEPDAPLEDKE